MIGRFKERNSKIKEGEKEARKEWTEQKGGEKESVYGVSVPILCATAEPRS
jgi:hypothetical protein